MKAIRLGLLLAGIVVGVFLFISLASNVPVFAQQHQCICNLLVTQIAHTGKKLDSKSFIQPQANFKQKGTELTVTVEIPYIKAILCAPVEKGQSCSGTVKLSTTSSSWSVNGKTSTPSSESTAADGTKPKDGDTSVCEGKCDGQAHVKTIVATYTATFKPASLPVTGKITINWNYDCEGNSGFAITPQKMILVLDSNQKGGIDAGSSDWDGDGFTNQQESTAGTNPFDPNSHS